MDDRTLMAVCIADEAGNQPHEGRVAVGRVIANRAAKHYQSDGTMLGTVLHPMAFSGFWCDFVNERYTRVAQTLEQAQARADAKLARYSAQPLWADCLLAADQATGAQPFDGGPQYQKITPETLLYYAPSAVPNPPAWATPDKLDAVIYAHHFFHP